MLRRLPRAEHRRVRWKNGLGWTTELAVEPAEGEFDWRVSIAEVDTDCDFSRFPGIDRSLLVLEGEGMAVHVEGQAPVRLLAQGEALRFSGELATRCELLGGPTRDFNVMTRRGVIEHELSFERVVDRRSLTRGFTWLLYVVRGEITIDAMSVMAGDAVIAASDHSSRVGFDVEGIADLVTVRLRTHSAAVEDLANLAGHDRDREWLGKQAHGPGQDAVA